MRIPRQEDVSILFVSELAKNYDKEFVSLSDIASHHGISPLFLKKLARYLRMAGLIIAKEGTGGGYALAKPPDAISVWDVLTALKPERSVPTDLVSRQNCPLLSCCLPQHIRRVLDISLKKSFSNITIEDLIYEKN